MRNVYTQLAGPGLWRKAHELSETLQKAEDFIFGPIAESLKLTQIRRTTNLALVCIDIGETLEQSTYQLALRGAQILGAIAAWRAIDPSSPHLLEVTKIDRTTVFRSFPDLPGLLKCVLEKRQEVSTVANFTE